MHACINLSVCVHMLEREVGREEGKVNIMGGDSSSHCEKKNIYMNKESNSEW